MRRRLACMVAVLFVGSGVLRAQPAPAGHGGPAALALDIAGLERAFDAYFDPATGVAFTGAVVAVVHDGRFAFTKAYGYEDAARTTRVSAEETRFRLGSITKTLVAVHVASLIDAGIVTSIDDEVNRYLTRLQVPANDGRPVTLRMLATHQAGLAEKRQAFMRPGDRLPDIDGPYILANLPGFVAGPNRGANYSNVGIALLEYAMEDAGGRSFDDFAAREVFARAGMRGALIATEPAAFPRGAQAELIFPDGAVNAIPDGWANHPVNKAAGAMAATGADMARYMIGLLGGSEALGVPALLSERGRALAFDALGTTHPRVQRFGLVFMVNDWNGERLVEHGGRTLGTSSYLTLLPGRNLGVFVAATGERGVSLPVIGGLPGNEPPQRREGAHPAPRLPSLISLRAVALEHLLGPYRPAGSESAAPASGSPSEYVGEYVGQRRPLASSSRWLTGLILGGALHVAEDGHGGLRIGASSGYRPIDRDVFWRDPAAEPRRPSGWSDVFVFRRDAGGAVVDGAFLYADVVYRRAQGLDAPSAQLQGLAWAALALFTGWLSVLWPRGTPGRVRAALVPLALIATPFVFFLSWPRAPVLPLAFVWITPADLAGYQVWLLATSALVASLPVTAARGLWRPRAQGWRGALARWHLALLSVAAIALLVAAWLAGMIGWNLD